MRVLAAVLCAGWLAGCTVTNGAATADGETIPDGAIRVAGVPFHPQDGFGCGPAAITMVMGWAGVTADPKSLTGQFYGVKDPRTVLADTARRYGLLAYPLTGMEALQAELKAGHPVLVVQNLGVAREPLWNCGVAVGYDAKADKVLMNSGGTAGRPMGRRLFERLWSETDQWGLVVLRPGDMPASATEKNYLAAAAKLQQAGRNWEAVLAYDAALAQWSNNAEALMGLGGSLYMLGDLFGASDAYKLAATVASDPAPALEAMAHVLSELGRREEALAAARKAAAAGGPRKASWDKAVKDRDD